MKEVENNVNWTWMYIRKTKARSNLSSGKMVKITNKLCGSYIKNKKECQSFGEHSAI